MSRRVAACKLQKSRQLNSELGNPAMIDIPHAPSNPINAAIAWLFAPLSPDKARNAAHHVSQEDPRSHSHRLQAAMRRRDAVRDALLDLLR